MLKSRKKRKSERLGWKLASEEEQVGLKKVKLGTLLPSKHHLTDATLLVP